MLVLQDRSQLRRVHLLKTVEHLKSFNSTRETEVTALLAIYQLAS